MVERGVDDDGSRQAGQRRAQRSDRGGDRLRRRSARRSWGRRPCSIAVPRPRTSHNVRGAFGDATQIDDVLEQAEAGADREALDGRVDEEAGLPARHQRDDNSALAVSSVSGAM